tara:strand:+ start:404 stop:847 length:444 start_codon:yes stop_codon:yes gene_type:complete
MKKNIKNYYVVLLARIVLGLVFIYASFDKIINPIEFSNSIDNYHITPIVLNNIFGLVIPWIEFVLGICLLFGVFLDGAAFISIGLLYWFIFIISQAIFRGIDLHCGCFSSENIAAENINLRLEMFKRIFEDFVFLVLAYIIKNRNKE